MITQDDLKVFLVEEDPFSQFLFQKQLTRLGFRVRTFSSGIACLEQMFERPDVIFVDLNLDDMRAIDLMRAIKRLLPDTYIVFLLGQENVEHIIQAMQVGAYEYIYKGEYEQDNIARVMQEISREKLNKSQVAATARFSLLSNLFARN